MSVSISHAMTNYEPTIGEDDILGGGSFGVVHKVRRKKDLKVNTPLVFDKYFDAEAYSIRSLHAKLSSTMESSKPNDLQNASSRFWLDSTTQISYAMLMLSGCRDRRSYIWNFVGNKV